MALIAFEKVVTLPLDLRNDLERSALVCLQDLDRDNWRDDDYGERRKKLCEWLGLLEMAKAIPRTWHERLLEDRILPASGV